MAIMKNKPFNKNGKETLNTEHIKSPVYHLVAIKICNPEEKEKGHELKTSECLVVYVR